MLNFRAIALLLLAEIVYSFLVSGLDSHGVGSKIILIAEMGFVLDMAKFNVAKKRDVGFVLLPIRLATIPVGVLTLCMLFVLVGDYGRVQAYIYWNAMFFASFLCKLYYMSVIRAQK
ncbi:hypothetical protein [Nitrospirillum viridazoti]|uniref:hypothetical protein n=1 Tax=Nitrospirillum viridazoti TaxID=3144925 RepID=UPI00110F8553|nr:hypothetical protein [Nitrospirillum amazonense]